MLDAYPHTMDSFPLILHAQSRLCVATQLCDLYLPVSVSSRDRPGALSLPQRLKHLCIQHLKRLKRSFPSTYTGERYIIHVCELISAVTRRGCL